jgi:hypothetical protein
MGVLALWISSVFSDFYSAGDPLRLERRYGIDIALYLWLYHDDAGILKGSAAAERGVEFWCPTESSE